MMDVWWIEVQTVIVFGYGPHHASGSRFSMAKCHFLTIGRFVYCKRECGRCCPPAAGHSNSELSELRCANSEAIFTKPLDSVLQDSKKTHLRPECAAPSAGVNAPKMHRGPIGRSSGPDHILKWAKKHTWRTHPQTPLKIVPVLQLRGEENFNKLYGIFWIASVF